MGTWGTASAYNLLSSSTEFGEVDRYILDVKLQKEDSSSQLSANRMQPPEIGSFALPSGEIHLWPVRLDGSESVVAACHSALSADELARTSRFRFEHLRREYTIAHGVLRYLLGRYLGTAPNAIYFAYGARNKPEISAPATEIRFNMSHSGGVVVYAIARGLELGVDIQQVRTMSHLSEIADRFFCEAEADELTSVPQRVRDHGFFLCWTRKEAYIKAVGDGLSIPLDSFRVTLRPGEKAAFVHIGHDSRLAAEWNLHDLAPVPNYACALAYHGRERSLRWSQVLDGDAAFAVLG